MNRQKKKTNKNDLKDVKKKLFFEKIFEISL